MTHDGSGLAHDIKLHLNAVCSHSDAQVSSLLRDDERGEQGGVSVVVGRVQRQ